MLYPSRRPLPSVRPKRPSTKGFSGLRVREKSSDWGLQGNSSDPLRSERNDVNFPNSAFRLGTENLGEGSKPMPRGFRIIAICLFSLLLSQTLWSQKDAGSIAGTIRDASGATVQQAKVTVTEVDKGTSLVTTTGSSGEYVASPLPIGRYSLKVEKAGFKTAVTQAIELQVQQRAVVDISLQVGTISEQVTVSNVAPLLETETSELGQVVDNHRVVNLPLNGRNFAQLAQLSAGVAPSEPGARNSGSYGFSSNGGRSYQNNILLDGIDNNSNLTDLLNNTSYVIQPSVDALQEFKVQTNAYSAEFGRGKGAILNASIKSGTNQLHGDVYEFLRNDKLDGRNFFDSVRPA